METMSHILTHNGRVTVKSPKGMHHTFQIKTQPKDAKFAPGQRILSVLTGPDNERDYTSFAFVDRKVRVFNKRKNDTFFNYVKVLLHPAHYEAMGMEFYWEAKCRRCNRTLTTPESIRDGIGPICAGK